MAPADAQPGDRQLLRVHTWALFLLIEAGLVRYRSLLQEAFLMRRDARDDRLSEGFLDIGAAASRGQDRVSDGDGPAAGVEVGRELERAGYGSSPGRRSPGCGNPPIAAAG
jgi:hypothetical protein